MIAFSFLGAVGTAVWQNDLPKDVFGHLWMVRSPGFGTFWKSLSGLTLSVATADFLTRVCYLPVGPEEESWGNNNNICI